MNIALLCVLIIITGETDGFHVENNAPVKEETGEKISPWKLQSFEHDDPKDAKTATWNQILADALVNRIKVFSLHKVTENEHVTDVGTKTSFLTNCISQMLHLYKTLVYDKLYERPHSTKARSYEDTEINKENRKVNNNAGKDENDFSEPKDEVEIFEPYHGKLCVDCENERKDAVEIGTSEIVETTEIVQSTVTACPVGLVASEEGRCTEPKSKFILSIPYQCPIGYSRDWLGYCRPQL